MIVHAPIVRPQRRALAATEAAFTLPELLIAVVAFLLLLGGILCANLFGLRMLQLTQAKLGATDEARKAVGALADDVRNCSAVWVGNVTDGVFVGHLDGEPQTGSSVLIYPTTNTTDFVIYFVNPTDQTFRRTASAAGPTRILAHSITNTLIFRAEDLRGNVLTNNENNRVIHLCLEVLQSQPELPTADSYKLETSVARRTL